MPVVPNISLESARGSFPGPDALNKRPFLQGVVHAAGAAVGYLPVAGAFGAIATQAGMPMWLSVLMSAWVYAGAAQMAGLQALVLGQNPLLAAVGMLVVNLRHVPMSLAVGPLFRRAGCRDRLALAQTLTDEAFALDLQRPGLPIGFHRGIHAACWASWVGGTAVGAVLGPVIPQSGAAFALPALFIALAGGALRSMALRDRAWLPVAGVVLVVVCHPAGAFADLAAMAAVTVVLTMADGRWGLARGEPGEAG